MSRTRVGHRLLAGRAERYAPLLAWFAAATQSGCGPLPRHNAVPRSEENDGGVLALGNIRYWDNEVTPQTIATALVSLHRERDCRTATGHGGALRTAYYLAFSGGGESGAFGAVHT